MGHGEKKNSNCGESWKKVKYQLVKYHNLPGYLRDNEYIMDHYRADWPLKQSFFSIFTLHNETLNVWTHLIGFFIFLWLTIYTAMKIPKAVYIQCLQHLPSVFRHSTANHSDLCILNSTTDNLQQPITRWPFFAFLIGAMFCLLSSTSCHLLCCHSQRLSNILLRVDYAGIATLISTSFYPLVYYSFICYPFFRNLYIGFITVLGFAVITFSLLPIFQKPELRVLRAVFFSAMGLSGIIPILHKQIMFWDHPEALHTTGFEVLMGFLYGVGALVYATQIPERWMPGKFDIAGHSHQLFHVLVVAGAYTHYRAGLVYLRWRDLEGC